MLREKFLWRRCNELRTTSQYRGRAGCALQHKRPTLSDIRDSGSIEQAADLVCFLYRDEYYYPDTTNEPHTCELHVAKHRNGPTGTMKFHVEMSKSQFFEIE